MVTMHAHHAYVQEAFRTGVAGYVVKREIVSELVHTIHEVSCGNTFVSPSLSFENNGQP